MLGSNNSGRLFLQCCLDPVNSILDVFRNRRQRSVDDFPCNLMAEQFFNGGGHLNASGGRINGTMEEAVEIVKKAIIAYENKLK